MAEMGPIGVSVPVCKGKISLAHFGKIVKIGWMGPFLKIQST